MGDKPSQPVNENKNVINILVFGTTGSGKSSICKLMTKKNNIKISDSAIGCTLETTKHEVVKNNNIYAFYDTAGLNEPDTGAVKSKDAALAIMRFMLLETHGFNIVLFVKNTPRIVRDDINNFKFLKEYITKDKIPILFIKTHCDDDTDLEWIKKNHEKLEQHFPNIKKICVCSDTENKKSEKFHDIIINNINQIKLEKPYMCYDDKRINQNIFKSIFNHLAKHVYDIDLLPPDEDKKQMFVRLGFDEKEISEYLHLFD